MKILAQGNGLAVVRLEEGECIKAVDNYGDYIPDEQELHSRIYEVGAIHYRMYRYSPKIVPRTLHGPVTAICYIEDLPETSNEFGEVSP